MIKNGDLVTLEYTLKLDDGTTADSNVGGEPLTVTLGEGRILPALEKELVGMKVDETRNVSLEPEEGYGPVNREAFVTVDIVKIPEEARRVGEQLVARDASGNTTPMRVHEIRDAEAVMDMNHPLAGRTLHFEVRILEVA